MRSIALARVVTLVVLSFALLTMVPTTTYAFMPLHMIAVRITDLRLGYRQSVGPACGGYLKRSQVGYQYNLSSAQLAHYGWANSYEVCYQGPSGSVTNEVHEFYGQRGARWFMRVISGTDLCGACGYHATWEPSVGQQSVGYTGSGLIGVIFRQSSYTVDLALSAGRPSKQMSLLALAHLVVDRIRSSG